MISYDEALRIICAVGATRELDHELLDVNGISGRVCAEDIKAPMANQPFDNSAMDGFAVCADELSSAAANKPIMLKVAGHIAAGELRAFDHPANGHCYEIMTGAPLPPGSDAVVPVEKTEKNANGDILFRAIANAGDHIRRAGEDYVCGDPVLAKATVLNSGHALALATLGVGQIKVFCQPKVGLISTGPEVIEDLSAPLQSGQIYNSTKPYLLSAFAERGIAANFHGTATDDPESFREKLSALIRTGADIAISTGAVSAGAHDFVPAVLKEMGAEILFHKVAIRPGKPILFAKFPDGPLFFGLPGNPASTAVGLRFFIVPLLRAMQGLPPEQPQYALLKTAYNKGNIPLRFFMRAQLRHNDDATIEVDILPRQQSFKVRPFVESNVWAAIPENAIQLARGAYIAVYQ